MKRAIASALTLFCVACGGGGEEVKPESTPAQAARARGGIAPAENEPPVIVEARFEPSNPGSSDSLSVALVVRDPDQDRVRTTVEWYRNGQLVEDLSDLSAPPGEFARGDRVYAIVYATDGTHDVTAQTASVSIGNAAPRVKSVRIKPDRPTALDLIEAEADASDADGDHVELHYRWFRNGEPVPEATNSRLSPGIVHRGDSVAVQVSATDGSDESAWTQSAVVPIANSAPTITSQPNYELSGSGQYSYEVGAKDPDGDTPLRYEIVQGPPGMTVDITSGLVTWRVPSDAKGVYPIELAVSDPHGGKTTQTYSLSVDWEGGEKNAKGAAPKGGAPAAGQARNAGKNVKPPAAKSADEEGDGDYTNEDQGDQSDEEEF